MKIGRSPCGERGLKSEVFTVKPQDIKTSLPVRGAWIEIVIIFYWIIFSFKSLPVRGAWIEIHKHE